MFLRRQPVLTSLGINFALLWKLVKREIHILVCTTNILIQMFTDCGEFSSIHTDHAQLVDLDEC